MSKPKRAGSGAHNRDSRASYPQPRPAKPHRKGARPARGDEQEPRSDAPRTKKRWANEPPGVRAMRESVRDAAIRAAGHPAPAPHARRERQPQEAAEPQAPRRLPAKSRTSTRARALKEPDPVAAAPEPQPEDPPVSHEAAAGPSFDELGLSATLREAVARAGYETPTPIQAGAIPVLLSGRDLTGEAQTGTGKTAAFALPAVQSVDTSNWATQVLILAPTRELAIQVAAEIQSFAAPAGVRVTSVYGGQPIDRQFRALKNGAQIVVGTPGRILDHMRRETLVLGVVKLCVLDEADEMLALGFLEDVEAILSALAPGHQTALFSATMSPRILDLSRKYLTEPVHVRIEAKRRTVETTKQTYYDVVPGKKLDSLARVLDMETPGPTIVFCRTRQETDDLAEALRLRGYVAESLNGDMGQAERERVLKKFRDGQADLLVATDVAARGLDIDTVTHVINYDIPWDVEQYIHRIGRTGRAGRTGDAITLVEPRQRRQLTFIEQSIGVKMTPARVPTASDIAARRRQRFIETVTDAIEAGDFDAYLQIVADLSETYDPSDVAAAALKTLWKSWASSPADIDAGQADADERAEEGMVRVFLNVGRQSGLRPGDIVGALGREIGLSGRDVGAINIDDRNATVEVPAGLSDAVIDALKRLRVRGRKVNAGLAWEKRGQRQ